MHNNINLHAMLTSAKPDFGEKPVHRAFDKTISELS